MKHLLFLPENPLLRGFLISLLFLGALGVRLFFINFFDFAPFRQIRSAIIARAMYYENNPNITDWKREVSKSQLQMESHLEPRIMEHLAVKAYQLVGNEKVWIPKFLSTLWWVIGGGFLFLSVKQMSHSLEQGLLASTFYLLLPFAGVASRGFQPDSLTILLTLMSLYVQILYFERLKLSNLLLMSAFSGLSILSKPHCLFFLYGAFFSLSLWKKGFEKTLCDGSFFIFVIVSGTLGLGYYFYGASHGASADISPNIWLHFSYWFKPTYWGGWLAQIHQTVSFTFFIAGFVGFCFLHRELSKALLIGLWSGYVIFGLVFAYHISTHDYYQLFFVPILAISLAPVFHLFLEHLRKIGISKNYCLGLYSFCVLLGIAAIGIQIMIINYDRHGRWQKNEKEIAVEIGNYVQHSRNVLYLGISEGYPLRYYGEISGAAVNISNEVIDQHLGEKKIPDPAGFIQGKDLTFKPEYFVITELLEYKRKPQLSRFLEANFPLLVHTTDYMIFDLRKRLRQPNS